MAKIPCSLSVFTLDTQSYLCSAQNVTLTIENQTEEGACMNDVWASPVVSGKSWSLSVSGPIDTAFYGLLEAHADPEVTVAMTVLGGAWTGTAIVVSGTGEHGARSLDKSSLSLQGRGVLTWTAAG
jgi:hypothetical protein